MMGTAAGQQSEQGADAGRPRPHLELQGVSKRFGEIQAVRDVDLTVERGAIHGLVGENGAGKSTLGKIITGVHRRDGGKLLVDGRPVDYRSPREALLDGLVLIAQELTLVPRLSVLENILLGVQESRLGVLRSRLDRRRFADSGLNQFDLPLDTPVGDLRIADQQKVEIMRAITRDARLIVMDEPTAALTTVEAQTLFSIMREQAERGTTIVFISHSLGDVLDLCDTITIMRDGEVVRTKPARKETIDQIVTGMIGRSLEATFPPKRPLPEDAPIVFSARGLGSEGKFKDVSFEVRAGEILGVAGLIGSGRSEVAHAIFGALKLDHGTLELEDKPVTFKNPRQAMRHGVALVPESRKDQGLVLTMSVAENVTLPHLGTLDRGGVVARSRESEEVSEIVRALDVRGATPRGQTADLSGGNQQKVLFAKWLLRRPRLLIADEPTRGVDVGAKLAIYELLSSLAAEGMGIVVISSDLEEVLGLAHRVLVMRAGSVSGELTDVDATEEQVLRLAFDNDPNHEEVR